MDYSPEKAVKKEIEKVQDWYKKTYKEDLTWMSRYDKVEKHWSWQIIPTIKGKEVPFQFGVSTKTAEGQMWPMILMRLGQSLRTTIVKAYVRNTKEASE